MPRREIRLDSLNSVGHRIGRHVLSPFPTKRIGHWSSAPPTAIWRASNRCTESRRVRCFQVTSARSVVILIVTIGLCHSLQMAALSASKTATISDAGIAKVERGTTTILHSPFAEQRASKRSNARASPSPILITISTIIVHGPSTLGGPSLSAHSNHSTVMAGLHDGTVHFMEFRV
jgi:hypothetical protein